MAPAQADLFAPPVRRWATFSPCSTHGEGCPAPACVGRPWRYDLGRVWSEEKAPLLALMLNPSTADADRNDPTVAKMEGWAREWGFGGLVVCNLFAFRATDPKAMKRAADPVGPGNDEAIDRWAAAAGLILCGWGANAAPDAPGWPKGSAHRGRAAAVASRLLGAGCALHRLELTAGGQPQHPLYLSKDRLPIAWRVPGETP